MILKVEEMLEVIVCVMVVTTGTVTVYVVLVERAAVTYPQTI